MCIDVVNYLDYQTEASRLCVSILGVSRPCLSHLHLVLPLSVGDWLQCPTLWVLYTPESLDFSSVSLLWAGALLFLLLILLFYV
jgi:hypothetical protein